MLNFYHIRGVLKSRRTVRLYHDFSFQFYTKHILKTLKVFLFIGRKMRLKYKNSTAKLKIITNHSRNVYHNDILTQIISSTTYNCSHISENQSKHSRQIELYITSACNCVIAMRASPISRCYRAYILRAAITPRK